jgi:hypothetical protein
MTLAAMSAMSSRPPRPTTVWLSSDGLVLDAESGKSAHRNTKAYRVSGLSTGYAIRNSPAIA